jgi:hypothetical protein
MIGPVDNQWLERAKAAGVKPEVHPSAQRFMVYVTDRPAALLNLIETPLAFEPHLQWFPWATKREIYKGCLKVRDYITKIKNMIVMTACAVDFYDAWAKRGLIRKVGYLQSGGIHIYEAVKQ